MPAVARGFGTETVFSPDGTGYLCMSPIITSTGLGSLNVFVNGVGVVRAFDPVMPHTGPGCVPHAPVLTSFSSTVYINNLGCGRLGDAYVGHIILTGSGDVFAGG